MGTTGAAVEARLATEVLGAAGFDSVEGSDAGGDLEMAPGSTTPTTGCFAAGLETVPGSAAVGAGSFAGGLEMAAGGGLGGVARVNSS